MASVKTITVLFVSGQGLLRDAFHTLIRSEPDFQIVGVESTGIDAVHLAAQRRPDIVLIDADLPKEALDYLIRSLPAAAPRSRAILLFHKLDHVQAVRAVRLGVRGLVNRSASSPVVFKSIRKVMAGEYWITRDLVSELAKALADDGAGGNGSQPFNLTPREREVLALVASGYTNKDTAERLGLSVETVKHHLTSIFDKTGVSSRLELATFAVAHGLTDASEST